MTTKTKMIEPGNGTQGVTTTEARQILADEQEQLRQRQQEAERKIDQFLQENGYQIAIVGVGKKSKDIYRSLADFLPDGIDLTWVVAVR